MAGRKPTVDDVDILKLFVLSSDPAFTASELTDELDMSRQGILKRLDGLDEDGFLESKFVGPIRIFWITEKGKRKVEASI